MITLPKGTFQKVVARIVGGDYERGGLDLVLCWVSQKSVENMALEEGERLTMGGKAEVRLKVKMGVSRVAANVYTTDI